MTSTTGLTLGERILSVPVEIQNEIFHYCLQRTFYQYLRHPRRRVVPSLLVAFRADKYLYMQALKIYYAINRFDLHDNCIEAFNHLHPSTVALIRNLDTLVPECDPHNSYSDNPYTGVSSKLLSAQNLRSLRFSIRSYKFDERYPETTLRSFLKLFPKLNEFTVIMFQYEISLTTTRYLDILLRLSQLLDGLLDPKLKAEHKRKLDDIPQPFSLHSIEWNWTAPAGCSVHRVGAQVEESSSDPRTKNSQ